MFKAFSTLLEKMGNWFGIIFKIILPIIIMYRPIRLAAYTVYVYGTTLGGDYYTFNGLGEVIYYILYAIFILLVFLFPKAASGFEFVVIPYYFVSLILFKSIEVFELALNGLDSILTTYIRVAPFVALFFVGKILFYIFIRTNRGKIEEARRKKFKNREGLRS